MLHARLPLLPATAALLLAPVACRQAPPAPAPDPPRVRINGSTWTVELATTKMVRYRGLSNRTALAKRAGMLFIFPHSRPQAFCMRHCEIPLDIAFIDADLTVVKIHTMAVEPDRVGRKLYPSGAPVQYVLEVPGGAFGRAGVQAGQKVTLLGDIPDPAKAEP